MTTPRALRLKMHGCYRVKWILLFGSAKGVFHSTVLSVYTYIYQLYTQL